MTALITVVAVVGFGVLVAVIVFAEEWSGRAPRRVRQRHAMAQMKLRDHASAARSHPDA